MTSPDTDPYPGLPTHAPWFARAPIITRRQPPRFDGVTVGVVVDLRALEDPAAAPPTTLEPDGGRGRSPAPDIPRVSHREYGHRVGIFRLLAACRRHGLRPAVVLDVLTAEHYPAVVDAVLAADAEIIAGGLSAGRAVTSELDSEVEQRLVRSSLDRLERAIGQRVRGWSGPEQGESVRTPGILAASGLEYVLDWANDEQPLPLSEAAPLWSIPISWELSDLAAMYHRQVLPWTYARSVSNALEQLEADAQTHPRVLLLHLHPWLSGQPFRMTSLDPLLDRLSQARPLTPGEILDRWRGRT